MASTTVPSAEQLEGRGPAAGMAEASPDADAYHGLAGDIVGAIALHTEADPVAVLAQLLVCCGSVIGRGAYFEVEATITPTSSWCSWRLGQGAKGCLVRP